MDLLKLETEKVEMMLRGVNYYRVKTKHLFLTAEGRRLWEDAARGNIRRELDSRCGGEGAALVLEQSNLRPTSR